LNTSAAPRPSNTLPGPPEVPVGTARPVLRGSRARIAVVINPAARALGRSLRAERLARALGERCGVAAGDIRLATPAGLADAIERAADTRPDVIALACGDGSARTALEILTPRGIPTAVLPCGTLNRIAAAAWGTTDMTAILGALAHGSARSIAGGIAGQHRFFCASGFGEPMRLGRLREDLRLRAWGRAWRSWREMAPFLFRSPVRLGPERVPVTCAIVAVGPIDAAFGLAPQARPANLEAAGALWRGWGDALGFAPSVLGGGWRRRAATIIQSTGAIRVEGDVDVLPALMDGEAVAVPSGVEIVYQDDCGLVWGPSERRTW